MPEAFVLSSKLTWGIPPCAFDVLPKVPNLILANLQQIQSAVSSAWERLYSSKARNAVQESELLHDGGVYLLPPPRVSAGVEMVLASGKGVEVMANR